jgi:DNA-binding CsgD family transcriptional regulator
MRTKVADPLTEASNDYCYEIQNIASLRGGPGILILSGESKLLHMNRRGWELIREINESQLVKAGGLLPSAISQVCSEIHDLLKIQQGPKDWEQVEVRRLAGGATCPVLLRGFGLPGGNNAKQSRVLIIMEAVGRREKLALQAKERFQLTEREQTVVQNLAKGWTNKEIALELGITEPTVKAHIKHIMEKTRCTTRTGIVAQLFHS